MNSLRYGLLVLGLLASHASWAGQAARCTPDSPLPACQYQQAGLASCQDQTAANLPACLQQFTPPALCRRERDRAGCEQLAAAQQACRDMAGAARRQCVANQLTPPACPASQANSHCQARQAALQQCGALFGSQRRQCLHLEMRKRQDDGSALR